MDWIGSLINKIKKVFDPYRSMDNDQKLMILQLMNMVEKTQEIEYSCDDVFQLLDEYAERILGGQDADRMMPLIKHHLDLCPDCREEFESLLAVINAASV